MRSKSVKFALVPFFLSLVICTPCSAQRDEDWDWVNNHFGTVLEQFMPIEQSELMNIGFRTHRDLHTEILEYSFLLTYDYPKNTVTAVERVPDTTSVYDQLMKLHRKRPKQSINNLKKRIRIKESHFTEIQCPAIKTLFFQFDKIMFHAPTPDSLVLHPTIYELKSNVGGGTMYLSFVNEKHPLIDWALRVKAALKTCATISGGSR